MFDIKYAERDTFLKSIDCLSAESANLQLKKFRNSKSNDFLSIDGRGGKRKETIIDDFPELKTEAILFIMAETSKKDCNFTILKLAQFITEKYYEITGPPDEADPPLVRSEESTRRDLERWGVTFDSNSKRPYFEGHEREDVVAHRKDFTSNFIENKDRYYRVDERLKWIEPTEYHCIRVAHDESAFRSNEQNKKHWVYLNSAPFHSKGRGRTLMISDFLVHHPSGPFLILDEEEWKKAVKRYPDLLDESFCDYDCRSCTGSMIPGQDGYFDNDCILSQFKRAFQMLQFKEIFNHPLKHTFEFVVDNARTHTKKLIDINQLQLKPGGRCPIDKLEWLDDNGNEMSLDLFFDDGPHMGESKGLKPIAIELGLELDHLKLPDLRLELAKHPAFKCTTITC